MYLLAFVICLVSCSSVLTVDLVLKASTKEVVDGVTDKLTVDCKPSSPPDSDNISPVYVHLFRNDGSGRNLVAKNVQGETIVREDNRTSAKISVGDPAFLTVNILDPTYSDEGVYECKFVYVKNDGNVIQLKQSVNVTVVDETPADVIPLVVPEESACDCGDIWKEINAIKASLAVGKPVIMTGAPTFDDSCRVSFSAKLSGRYGYPIEDGALAPFNEAISNQGGAFDGDRSVFTAPCPGQYYFSLTLRSQQELDSGYVDGLILVDGQEVVRTSVFVDAPITNYESATNGAVVSLKQGQEVTVQIRSTSSGSFKSSSYSIFSGFYLFP